MTTIERVLIDTCNKRPMYWSLFIAVTGRMGHLVLKVNDEWPLKSVCVSVIGLIRLAFLVVCFESRAQELVYLLQMYGSYYIPQLSIPKHSRVQ